MQDFICSGEIRLDFFPRMFDLLDVLAELALIYLVVCCLLLLHAFASWYGRVKNQTALLLLAELF